MVHCRWFGVSLIFLPLIHISGSTQNIWKCSGLKTKYTTRVCETDKSKMESDLCYFLPHFQQYRPCSAICNDVVFGSIDEERCRGYCPGTYFEHSFSNLIFQAFKWQINNPITILEVIIVRILQSCSQTNIPW